jgi:hypothetical protein
MLFFILPFLFHFCSPQQFTFMFTASDYSAVLSLGPGSTGSAASNTSSTAITFGGDVSRTGFTLERSLTVTLVYTGASRCVSYGDPHISTFDSFGYGFQLPGTATCFLLCRCFLHSASFALAVACCIDVASWWYWYLLLLV